MMERKNDRILIYDKTDFLTKIVKHFCGNNTDLIFHNVQDKIKLETIKAVDIAYIKSSNYNDLEEILLIYNNTKQIYIETESKKIKNAISKLKNVIYFNIDRDRFFIMTQIFNNENELN